ncbi:MAG: sulfite exporter TauE/SafE family protein [Saccharospirillum sp.]|uniref:sulfite exporter TauE/SafE family protein n=1 Tax=Saccharospirillum sp. TaxID=2033801 RepID=UPI00349FFD0E
MLDASSLLIIAGTFLVAGAVKGVIGLGLPSVSLAFLAVAMDLPTAMALLLVPSFVTNIWQSVVGGSARAILVRLWPFLAMATITVWIGAAALTRINLLLLTALLGGLLITYSVVNLVGFRMVISSRQERWAGPLFGVANGVLTGMTGSFVVPGVMFLQAIGLPRNMLIQAMGMLFTVSTVALAAALQQSNFLTLQSGAISVAAVIPAIAGMILGQRIRNRLSEQTFRTVFFVSLFILGTYIIASSLRVFY